MQLMSGVIPIPHAGGGIHPGLEENFCSFKVASATARPECPQGSSCKQGVDGSKGPIEGLRQIMCRGIGRA